MNRLAFAAAVAALTTAGFASHAKPASKAPPAPVLPPPSMQLEIVPIAELHGPWRLRIVNTGTVPVRLAADAHLVALDVTPAPSTKADADDDATDRAAKKKSKAAKAQTNKKKTDGVLHCRFPLDMRPSDDDTRALIVPPNRAYVEAFDIRAACFGAELDAIAPGATVTPHFGWVSTTPAKKAGKATKARRFEAPFAVAPIDIDPTSAPIAQVSPLKQIDAAPYVLAAPTTTVAPHDDNADGDDDPATRATSATSLKLSLPRYRDQENRIDIASPVTVRNVDTRKHAIFFRASRISFDVVDPSGQRNTCGTPPDEQSLRELYTHLGPGQSASLPMMVSAVCDPETFARAGIYEITAHVDDRDLGGANVGLSAYDGMLTSGPMLLRLHTDARFHARRPPHLE